jgi:hypothetical protein
VHNDQASGSGFTRPMNLNSEEAQILTDNNILAPLASHLPHGWNMSTGGYAISPIPPEGLLLDFYIG